MSENVTITDVEVVRPDQEAYQGQGFGTPCAICGQPAHRIHGYFVLRGNFHSLSLPVCRSCPLDLDQGEALAGDLLRRVQSIH